ncbi:MAG: hypothetical protein EHM21_08745, partial [Chloroflexi bacterium]
MWLAWDLDLENEIWGNIQADYQEWLVEQENPRKYQRTRQPGILPVAPVQDAIDRYAWDHQPYDHRLPENLRSRLDDETLSRLLAAANYEPGLDLTETEKEFLRRYNLCALLAFADNPRLPVHPTPIPDGYALAGLRIIEDHTGPKGHPFKVDWEAIHAWLVEHLVIPPRKETVQPVIASAYAFFRAAPAPLLRHLICHSPAWHPAWRSLLWYALQRIPELLPNRSIKDQAETGEWGFYEPYTTAPGWERLLDAGTGSRLTLHLLKNNVEDLFKQPVAVKNRYWNAVRDVLAAGGGTLRRMDYPAFTLTGRPGITMVLLETLVELTRLARDLFVRNEEVTHLNLARLAEWIERQFNALSPLPLPGGLSRLIAGVLERHAIAYLVLKERVLREAFQAAPFRLRRKHIQRFWADQEAGEVAIQIPMNLEQLCQEFGPEPLKEALAHALLDHFKDEWGLAADPAHLLKETLLILLRSTALTYRLQQPWLPAYNRDPGEFDLEHTHEVASFLIQQTEHAPVELAQALLIDPQQGLPLLAGGQVTEFERNCRRLVRAAAGVSQKKVTSGEARVFTCRPISKVEAFDRGSLGGDCSSRSAPLRALSPHHIYYGIFENGEQQRGYMTVYEAWAEIVGSAAQKTRLPVLCLETINVPLPAFNAVQQDLLVIFEAIAKSRGLAERLVLITGITTWNYQNGEVLRQSRRFRQGTPVRLFPADPCSWAIYHTLAPEAEIYTAFISDVYARHYAGYFRLLAPNQASLEPVEAENLVEAERIANLPHKGLIVTAKGENGPLG